MILSDKKPVEEMIAAFREVRKLRSPRAHAPIEDRYDQKYFKQQRELILRTYKGVRLIRLIFQNHSSCWEYKVEDFLYEGKIRTF